MIVKPMSYICKQAHGCRVGLHFTNPSCALRHSPLTACTHLNTHLGWKVLLWSECWLHQQGWWTHDSSLHHAEGFTLINNVVTSDAVITVVLWSLLRHTKHTGCPHSSSAPHVSWGTHLQTASFCRTWPQCAAEGVSPSHTPAWWPPLQFITLVSADKQSMQQCHQHTRGWVHPYTPTEFSLVLPSNIWTAWLCQLDYFSSRSPAIMNCTSETYTIHLIAFKQSGTWIHESRWWWWWW